MLTTFIYFSLIVALFFHFVFSFTTSPHAQNEILAMPKHTIYSLSYLAILSPPPSPLRLTTATTQFDQLLFIKEVVVCVFALA